MDDKARELDAEFDSVLPDGGSDLDDDETNKEICEESTSYENKEEASSDVESSDRMTPRSGEIKKDFFERIFQEAPVISPDRVTWGRGAGGRIFGKLLVKDLHDPDFARIYLVMGKSGTHSESKYIFYECPCKKRYISHDRRRYPEDIVKGYESDHTCRLLRYREAFFDLKKSVIFKGKVNEVEEFEKQTYCKQTVPDLTKCDQRDWCFLDAPHIAKDSFILIREGDYRQIARVYSILEGATDTEARYQCSTCQGENKKAVAVMFKLPSKLQIVWTPPNEMHSDSCIAKGVQEQAEMYKCVIKDIFDMDLWGRVHRRDWKIGYGPTGESNVIVIIKDYSDKTRAYEYEHMLNHSFRCIECDSRPYAAHSLKGDGFIAAKVRHPNCQPKDFVSCLNRQREYSCRLPPTLDKFTELVISNDLQQIPKVSDTKIGLDDDQTELTMKASGSFQYKFDIVSNQEGAENFEITKMFKCVGCSLIAYLQKPPDKQFEAVREKRRKAATTIKCTERHGSGCEPLPIVKDELDIQLQTERSGWYKMSKNEEDNSINEAERYFVPAIRSSNRFCWSSENGQFYLCQKDPKYETRMARKFIQVENHPFQTQFTSIYKCLNCHCIAFLTREDAVAVKPVIRSTDIHEMGCEQFPLASFDLFVTAKVLTQISPIIDRNRWFLGCGKTKKFDQLLVRSLDFPDMVYQFRNHCPRDEGIQVFFCDCKQVLIYSFEDEELRGDDVVHECDAAPLKDAFFEMKKWTVAVGSRNQLNALEQATESTCNEPGYTRVDERNFLYADSRFYEKNSIMFVLEQDDRQYARKYVRHKLEYSDDRHIYECEGCLKSKAVVICYTLESGLHAVWQPDNSRHEIGCTPQLAETLCGDHNTADYDVKDLDFFRWVPDGDWFFGSSPEGHAKRRLIVGEAGNLTLCREYERKDIQDNFFVFFECVGCKQVFKFPGNVSRMIAPNISHSNCEPVEYESVLLDQEEYSGCLSAKSIKAMPLGSIQEPIPRIYDAMMNAKGDTMFIKGTQIYDYKFKLTRNPRRYRETKTMKCSSCSCLAFVRTFEGKTTIRSDSLHESHCKPLPLEYCRFTSREAVIHISQQVEEPKRELEGFNIYKKDKVIKKPPVPRDSGPPKLQKMPKTSRSFRRVPLKRPPKLVDERMFPQQRICIKKRPVLGVTPVLRENQAAELPPNLIRIRNQFEEEMGVRLGHGVGDGAKNMDVDRVVNLENSQPKCGAVNLEGSLETQPRQKRTLKKPLKLVDERTFLEPKRIVIKKAVKRKVPLVAPVLEEADAQSMPKLVKVGRECVGVQSRNVGKVLEAVGGSHLESSKSRCGAVNLEIVVEAKPAEIVVSSVKTEM